MPSTVHAGFECTTEQLSQTRAPISYHYLLLMIPFGLRHDPAPARVAVDKLVRLTRRSIAAARMKD